MKAPSANHKLKKEDKKIKEENFDDLVVKRILFYVFHFSN